jgi:Phosphatidyl serine synthase
MGISTFERRKVPAQFAGRFLSHVLLYGSHTVVVLWIFILVVTAHLLSEMKKTTLSVLVGGACIYFSMQPSPPSAFLHLLLVIDLTYIFLLIVGIATAPQSTAWALHNLDPGHSGMPEKLHARTNDCSLTRANVWQSIDIYVVAHLVGFGVKASILPDRRVLWASALFFEAAEFTLGKYCSSVLSNLSECLWDRLVLDLAICNFAGMEIGLRLADRRRARGAHSLYQVVALGALVAYADVSAFLLKAALHLRTSSPLHAVRLFGIASLAVPAVHQYTRWCTGSPGGPHMYALLVTLVVEGLFATVQFAREFHYL